MMLAITGLGGQNANKETLNNNILAANDFAFYQAKNIRQTSYQLAADEIELAWLTTSGVSPEAREALAKKAAAYRATAARYESEPETGDGKKELLARARTREQARDHAMKQDPYFDYAEALMQIAIVLISVSMIAEIIWLAFLGVGLGIAGGADAERVHAAGGCSLADIEHRYAGKTGLPPSIEDAEHTSSAPVK